MRPAVWVQESPLGPMLVATSAAGVREIDLRAIGATGLDQPVEEVAERLDAYFGGELDAVDALAVDLAGRSLFSTAVLTTLRHVEAKSVTSYGRLAEAAGWPGAGRAVGGAVGANPVPIIVPCHRVVAGDGSLGGFGYGPDVKRWLLAHEGHPVDGARPFAFDH